jgi:hypothetical protein
MPWPSLKKILRRQANIQLVEGACLIDCTHRLPRAYGHKQQESPPAAVSVYQMPCSQPVPAIWKKRHILQNPWIP